MKKIKIKTAREIAFWYDLPFTDGNKKYMAHEDIRAVIEDTLGDELGLHDAGTIKHFLLKKFKLK